MVVVVATADGAGLRMSWWFVVSSEEEDNFSNILLLREKEKAEVSLQIIIITIVDNDIIRNTAMVCRDDDNMVADLVLIVMLEVCFFSGSGREDGGAFTCEGINMQEVTFDSTRISPSSSCHQKTRV